MNSHVDIQRRLPAYCGGDLEPAEQQLVERHLAECPACRAELAEQQTTLRLIRGTPEVEPPPWLAGRIMARVRERQTAKRSWLQRFFFPLNIKLPLEAIALLVVCVSGYYLTRTAETELARTGQHESRTVPAQKAPPPVQAPPGGNKEEPSATVRPQHLVPPESAPTAVQRSERLPPETAPYTPAAPAPVSPPQRDHYGVKAESIKAAPTAESASRSFEAGTEMKSKSSRGLDRQTDTAAPAAAGRAAGAPSTLALQKVLVRLSVDDPSTAPALIREALIHSGGTIIDERNIAARRLMVRLPAVRQKEFIEELQRLGMVTERPAPPPSGAQLLELTVQW
jgi:anti-sigma factor RsiW